MRTRALLLAFAALIAPPLAALQLQTDPAVAEGSVVASGSASLVITTPEGTTRTFVVDPETTLPVGDLAPGTPVAVRYRSLDADRALALTVSLLDAAGQAPSSATVPSPSDAPPSGPEDVPLTLLGVASLGLVTALVFAWVFARRRHSEVPHLSL